MNEVLTEQAQQIEELTTLAVQEVFLSMVSLQVAIEPPVHLPATSEGQIIGSVGFIGEATGVIYLYAQVGFAKIITARMLGITEQDVDSDEMVNDAMGELSNMVVGYVKSRLCDRGLPCTITIPSIVRGQQLSIERPNEVIRRALGFRAGEHHLLAEVLLKNSKE